MPRIASALALALVTASAPLSAQDARPDTLEIYTAHDSERERTTLSELREVLEAHDVTRWIVTPVVRIDATQIPHSHPVLTLHSRHNGEPLHLLSTFLHEQFHWWVIERADALAAARADLRNVFPEVPVGGGEGAGSVSSTYLHLVVCHLELQAMTALVGAERTRAVLASATHYTWIYDRVLNDPRVDEIVRRHGLVADAPQ